MAIEASQKLEDARINEIKMKKKLTMEQKRLELQAEQL
jgi:hypothetical protein